MKRTIPRLHSPIPSEWVEVAYHQMRSQNYSALTETLRKQMGDSSMSILDSVFYRYFQATILHYIDHDYVACGIILKQCADDFERLGNHDWNLLTQNFLAVNSWHTDEPLATQEMFEKLLADAELSDDRWFGSITLCNYAVFCTSILGKPQLAISHLERAVNCDLYLGNHYGASQAFGNLLALHRHVGNVKEALHVALQSLALFEDAERDGNGGTLACVELSPHGFETIHRDATQNLATILHAYSSVLNSLGDAEGALAAATRCLRAVRQFDNPYLRSLAHGQLGSVLEELGRAHEALDNFYQAREILQTLRGYEYEKTIIHGNIATLEAKQGNYAQARQALLHVLETSRVHHLHESEAAALANLGEIYLGNNAVKEGIESLELALTLGRRISAQATIVKALRLLGKAYRHQDSSVSLQHLQSALIIAEDSGMKPEQKTIHEELCSYYKQMGNTERALYHSERIYELHKTISTEYSQRQIANMQVVHEVESIRRDLELQTLKISSLENELQSANRELARFISQIVEKQEFVRYIERGIQNIIQSNPHQRETMLVDLLDCVRKLSSDTADWEQFGVQFESAHRNYVQKLLTICPALTPSEIRICVLLRLSLSTKQIADVLRLSTRSVDNHRFNIRKKINPPDGRPLAKFLLDVDFDVVE